MIPERTYYRDLIGRIYGPYTDVEFWSLVEQNRINESSNLSSDTNGPWSSLLEYLAGNDQARYYFLVPTQEQLLGPVPPAYLRVLNIQTSEVMPSTPVAQHPSGPWKLISETNISLLKSSVEPAKMQISTEKEMLLATRCNTLFVWLWVLVVVTLLGSASGSGLFRANRRSPEGLEVLIVAVFSIAINPFTWVTYWIYKKFAASRCCPRCGEGQVQPKPNTEYLCFRCKTAFRTPEDKLPSSTN